MPARRASKRVQQNSWVKPETAIYIKFLSSVLSKDLGTVIDLLVEFHKTKTQEAPSEPEDSAEEY